MVINYKRLNDKIAYDAYLMPNNNQLINKIQGVNIFSKFDYKSGYYHIKMHLDLIEWTTFVCSNLVSHYEWLVMPFGLKNGPSIFQKRMDNTFKDYSFVMCYIYMIY